MNARDNIKPKTIRLAILIALSDGAIATIDDLQDRMDEPRAKIASNVHPTMAEGLIKRLRDDVTSLPAYQITPKGREYLTSFSGGKAEAVEPVVKESSLAESAASKDAEIARLAGELLESENLHCSLRVITPPGGESKTTCSASQMTDYIAGLKASVSLLQERVDHITLMLLNSSAEALAFEGPIELLLANILHKAAHQQAPVGYVVKRPDSPLMRFTKQESARARALSAARRGEHAKVFALVPAGVAVPGAEWRPA